MAGAPTPLAAPQRVLALTDTAITTATAVGPGEECFAGHYPGFPIFPGVLLIETVSRAVHHYATHRLGRHTRIRTLHAVRFSAPVGPGDEITTECRLARAGDLLEVKAQCRTARGRAASVQAGFELAP